MKIVTIIVLYNPESQFISNYYGYSSFSDSVLFIDNSTIKNDSFVKQIRCIPNSLYFSMDGNKGIASALNRGIELGKKFNPDYFLTMDQDSIFPFSRYGDILKVLTNKIHSDYAIIGLNINSKEKELCVVDTRCLLTSGNFINANKLLSSHVIFRDYLFIDAVDNAIDYDFFCKGYKIGFIKGVSLVHVIGKPKTINLGLIKFTLLNYSPIRYYYIFRNNYYLYYENKPFFKKNYFKVKFIIYFKVLFFESNKRKKLLAMSLGKADAKKGILGECNHNEIK